ncbi:hypothetical protein KCP78_19125 [Salmonella enterica subsp. enterica]|nr:hypothetical protein KCP78_19125 [Salmonella enterica subsp. enterica]
MLRGYHPHYAVEPRFGEVFCFSGVAKRVIINPGDYRRSATLITPYSKRVNS